MIAWLEHKKRTPNPSATDPADWDYIQLTCALILAFLVQSLFLPCLCRLGTARMQIAIIIDVMVAVRIIVARIRHEQGKGWIFYIVLLYSSPMWIRLLMQHDSDW